MAECHLAWIIWWKSLSVTSEYGSRGCWWGKGRRALTDVFCSGSRISHVQAFTCRTIFSPKSCHLEVSCQGIADNLSKLHSKLHIYQNCVLVTHICKGSTEIYLLWQKEIIWIGRVHFDSAGNTFSLNNDHHHFHSAWFQTDGKGWLGRSRKRAFEYGFTLSVIQSRPTAIINNCQTNLSWVVCFVVVRMMYVPHTVSWCRELLPR